MRLATTGLVCVLECLAQAQVITLPAGTRIPLVLTSPLASWVANPGDSVHAETAAPVVAGNQVAIPPGVYVEGTVSRVRRHGRHAGFEMRFTRIIFDNGYTVPLAGSSSVSLNARLQRPAVPGAPAGGMVNGLQACPVPPCLLPQPLPQPTPPKLNGPNVGAIVGTMVAATAAGIVAMVLVARHSGAMYLDAGSSLDLVLERPLLLDQGDLAAGPAAEGRSK